MNSLHASLYCSVVLALKMALLLTGRKTCTQTQTIRSTNRLFQFKHYFQETSLSNYVPFVTQPRAFKKSTNLRSLSEGFFISLLPTGRKTPTQPTIISTSCSASLHKLVDAHVTAELIRHVYSDHNWHNHHSVHKSNVVCWDGITARI